MSRKLIAHSPYKGVSDELYAKTMEGQFALIRLALIDLCVSVLRALRLIK